MVFPNSPSTNDSLVAAKMARALKENKGGLDDVKTQLAVQMAAGGGGRTPRTKESGQRHVFAPEL